MLSIYLGCLDFLLDLSEDPHVHSVDLAYLHRVEFLSLVHEHFLADSDVALVGLVVERAPAGWTLLHRRVFVLEFFTHQPLLFHLLQE